eukprot:TRINITY_DN7946_c0_g1_i1.p1 TRINITY_DN7946_c0_g1~~TRINITY_DN7946_c0_g1_i1.p1  ORF type:complete len:789 (-),score=135.05 TRINITY_DN7946_c0_g1_i1:2656-5022(-)
MGDTVAMRTSRAVILLAGCFFVFSGFCHAAEWHRLAYSKKMGAEVFASQSQSGWCKDTVQIEVKLSADSPLLSNGLEAFLQKVGVVAAKDCNSLTAVQFSISDSSDAQVGQYTASAGNEWTAEKVVGAPTPRQLHDTAERPAEPPVSSFGGQGKSVEAKYLDLVAGVMPPSSIVFKRDGAVLDYIKLGNCEAYVKAKNDEFELAKLEHEFRDKAEAFLDVPKPEFIEVELNSKLGRYDFNKEAFQFQPFSPDENISVERKRNWRCSENETFPKGIRINIRNGEVITSLSMTKEKAEQLLKQLRTDRQVILKVKLRPTAWHTYLVGSDGIPQIDASLHSLIVLGYQDRKAFYEYPNSWLEPKISDLQAEKAKAEELRQQQLEKERVEKEQAAKAKAERIKAGIEPLELDGAVAMAHFKRLSSPELSDSFMLDGVDARRPLAFQVSADFQENVLKEVEKGNRVVILNQRMPRSGVPVLSIRSSQAGNISVEIQNNDDFKQIVVPEDVLAALHDDVSKEQAPLQTIQIRIDYLAEPVGYRDDAWKGGNALVVHATKATYSLDLTGMWKTIKTYNWQVEATSPKKEFVQKKDERTARELSIIGLKGGMEQDDVKAIVENKLNLSLSFDENVKELSSSQTVPAVEGDILTALFAEGPFTPGQKAFKALFVQTGKSLMGLGSPIYSMKQAVLLQTASAQEKDAIIDGLKRKFGTPDLVMDGRGVLVFNWGKRISDDRSSMLVGKGLSRPVSALEAQIYSSDKGVITMLVLSDQLYTKKTNITTQTVFQPRSEQR